MTRRALQRQPRTPAWALALAAVAGLAGAGSALGGSPPGAPHQRRADAPVGERVAAILRGARGLEPDAPERGEAARELAGLGAALVPEAISLTAGAPLVPDGPGGAPERLDRAGRELLLDAVAHLPAHAVAQACAELLGEEPADPALRLAAVRLLGRAAGADELLLLLELAAGTNGGRVVEPIVRDLLRRDERAFAELERAWGYVPDDLAYCVLRALGSAERAEGLPVLVALLGRRPAPEGLVLAQIGRLAPEATPALAEGISDSVLRYLDADHDGLQKAAALALGELGCDRAVPRLVEMLAEGPSGVAAVAHRALQRSSGLRLPADPDPWRSWHRQELDWRRTQAAEVFRDLVDPDEDVALRAARAVAAHRLGRHSLAEELAVALAHPSPRVRAAACAGLGRLASRAGTPALEAALEDEDEAVRAAARAALRSVSSR